MVLNIFVEFPVTALLISLQTPLMLYWRLVYFVIIVNISWLPNHWICSNEKVQCFLYQLDEDRVITGSENGCIRWEVLEMGRFSTFLLYLITSFISYINLVGILQNRVIQPIVEHSEYPVERLGMFCLIFFWVSIYACESCVYSHLRCLDD